MQVGFRQAKSTPTIAQDQRLAWLKELLSGESESLPYRAAGVLLLLYAQPLTRIASLQVDDVDRSGDETRIGLGKEPVSVPEPFAAQLNYHIDNRPNMRATAGNGYTPWLFPSISPGQHLDPQSIMFRLRKLGVNLRGSRSKALQELVSELPAPLVAEMLGYSDKVTQRHAELAGTSWARYAPSRSAEKLPKADPEELYLW